jgi:hypothetical protein
MTIRGVIIKPNRDIDEYVVWSTMCERPHFVGSREEVHRFVGPGDPHNLTKGRLDRADEKGTSSFFGEGGYGEGLIFEQRGYIASERLAEFSKLVLDDKLQEALVLCEPFEDEKHVRGAPCDEFNECYIHPLSPTGVRQSKPGVLD